MRDRIGDQTCRLLVKALKTWPTSPPFLAAGKQTHLPNLHGLSACRAEGLCGCLAALAFLSACLS